MLLRIGVIAMSFSVVLVLMVAVIVAFRNKPAEVVEAEPVTSAQAPKSGPEPGPRGKMLTIPSQEPEPQPEQPGATPEPEPASASVRKSAASAAPDSSPAPEPTPPPHTGASFAVLCDLSHQGADDPIVVPGKPGVSHRHSFFGNVSTDAHATRENLRKVGKTTCTRPGDTSAYWMPTVKWNGRELGPNRAVFYYRAGGKHHKQVRPFPAGLKVATAANKLVSWRCGGPANGRLSKTPPNRCKSGELGVRVIFPDCSNGRLNSANHRSHMAFSSRSNGDKIKRCPESHPRPVPGLTINATFPIPSDRKGKVALSSGKPSSMHADFFNTWDQEKLRALVKRCINEVPPSKRRPEKCRAPSAPPR